MDDSLNGNIAALRSFWNRRSFHDRSVESIDRCNARVIVTLDDYVLILIGAKRYRQNIDEFPTSWLSQTLEETARNANLNVSLELGEFDCEFVSLRLIRRSDYAILIPAIDPLH